MSKYNSLGELFAAIANAIRAKTGGTDPIVAEDFPAAVEGISAGGGDIDALIDGSLTEITSNAETVASRALENNSTITSVNLPLAKEIGMYAFGRCVSLTSVNAPEATKLGDNVFYGCSNLVSVNLPLVTEIGANTFEECVILTNAELPLLQKLSVKTFYNCRKLTSMALPSLSDVQQYTFYNCTSLITVDLSSAKKLWIQPFYSCYQFTTLILRSETMCTLASSVTNTFYMCPHFLGTVNATYNPDGLKDGYIYVPRALIEEYKAATNWVTFADQFRALEDYTVDGTTTGELDESKVSL